MNAYRLVKYHSGNVICVGRFGIYLTPTSTGNRPPITSIIPVIAEETGTSRTRFLGR